MAAAQCASWYAGAVNCGHQFGIHTGYSHKASHLYVDEDASAAWPFELMRAHTPVNNTNTGIDLSTIYFCQKQIQSNFNDIG
jgi:hypothetical protein